MIVADFASEYGIRLHQTANSELSWREFHDLTLGLLNSTTSRLGRWFHAQRDTETGGVGDE